MTKLDSLIAELCPDGVEYVNLADVARISNGKDHKHLADGDIPVYGSGGIMRYADQYIYNQESVLIPRKGSIGNIFYVNTPFWTVDTIFYTKISEQILPKYLYYYLTMIHVEDLNEAGGVPSLTKTVLDKVKIALPPLPIQREIVRILDNFTELTAELTARRKQYEYYRNRLLTFGDDVPIVALSHCCSSISDGDHQAPPKTDGGIPFITISNITSENQIDFSNTRFVPEAYYNGLDDKRKARMNDILYTVVGSFGIPVYISSDIEFAFQRHIAILRPNSEMIISKYLFHVLQSFDFLKQAEIVAVGAAQRTITLTSLNKMRIPLPSLDEQARIVDILDRFDALTTDISNGLPAEITARQKQYEYYRDKLLSFKEIA